MRGRKGSLKAAIGFVVCLALFPVQTSAGFRDFVGKLKAVPGLSKFTGLLGGGKLTEKDIVGALKQALEVGAASAIDRATKDGGYSRDPAVRIPLPPALEKVEGVLRRVGLGPQMDEFRLSINRAAERAAPAAKPIVLDAVKTMSFDDAKRILQGKDDEATQYFRGKTHARLLELFKPLVTKAMAEVNATRLYADLEAKVKRVPFAGKLVSTDLEQYASTQALDGLFTMLAEEESKIRRDPAARTTALLKKVFGSQVAQPPAK